MAEYLTIVRPLEIFWSKKFNCSGGQDLEEFLWADYKKGLWKGEFLSDLLKIETSSHKMRGLGFQEYRQVATAFMEKHMKYKVDEMRGVDAILDRQAGHSSRTAARAYAVASDDHGSVGREEMHLYYLASEEWQELLHCSESIRGTLTSYESSY